MEFACCSHFEPGLAETCLCISPLESGTAGTAGNAGAPEAAEGAEPVMDVAPGMLGSGGATMGTVEGVCVGKGGGHGGILGGGL